MFLLQSMMYFEAYDEFFNQDKTRALWFLQWFEGEAPKMWATGILLSVGTVKEHLGIRNWRYLLEEATAMWGPTDLAQDAARKLRSLRQTRSVAEYHAEFIQHALLSGYNDQALAEAFYFGLRASIKDMMVHEDRPGTLPKMLKVALRLETRILARMGERRAEGAPGPSRASAKATRLSPQQRTEYMKAGKCFECAQPGHRARNCPKKDKKEFAQAKKTNEEDTKSQERPKAKPTKKKEEEEEGDDEEDFLED